MYFYYSVSFALFLFVCFFSMGKLNQKARKVLTTAFCTGKFSLWCIGSSKGFRQNLFVVFKIKNDFEHLMVLSCKAHKKTQRFPVNVHFTRRNCTLKNKLNIRGPGGTFFWFEMAFTCTLRKLVERCVFYKEKLLARSTIPQTDILFLLCEAQ